MWSRLEPAMQHTFGKEMHNYAIVPSTLHRCFKYVNDDGKVHRMFVDKKPLKGKKKIYFTYAARRKTSKLKQSQKQSYVWRKKARVKLKIALHHSSKSPSWIRHLTSSPASQPPKQSNLLIQMRRSQSRLSLKSNSQIDPLMISTKLSRPSSVEPFIIGTKKVWTLHPANFSGERWLVRESSEGNDQEEARSSADEETLQSYKRTHVARRITWLMRLPTPTRQGETSFQAHRRIAKSRMVTGSAQFVTENPRWYCATTPSSRACIRRQLSTDSIDQSRAMLSIQ